MADVVRALDGLLHERAAWGNVFNVGSMAEISILELARRVLAVTRSDSEVTLVPYDEANIHVLSHSLHYGLAVFEGMRCYKSDNGRSAMLDQKLITSASEQPTMSRPPTSSPQRMFFSSRNPASSPMSRGDRSPDVLTGLVGLRARPLLPHPQLERQANQWRRELRPMPVPAIPRWAAFDPRAKRVNMRSRSGA